MKRFWNKLFTFRNLSKIITIFIVGIILRYFVNDCLNLYILVEYIDYISIIVGSIFNLLIESWLYIHCKLYGYGLATSYINDPNKSELGFDSEYYNSEGKIITSISNELSNYNLNSSTRKNIVSQLFEEIIQPSKFREVIIPTTNGTGNIYLGLRYYGKSSNAYGLYIKYHNLFNQEYVWHIWDKDTSGLEFTQVKDVIHPKIKIWKEMNETTGTNVVKEVRKLLKTDPFHMNKSN